MPYYTYAVSLVDENHPLYAHIPQWHAVYANTADGQPHQGPDLAYFKDGQHATNHCTYLEAYQYDS